jgi:hypothetical protein
MKCRYIYGSTALRWALAAFSISIVRRTPCTGDQRIARPLPTHITTQRINTDIHASNGIRTHGSSVREGEDSSCLRSRSHCDRRSGGITPHYCPRHWFEVSGQLHAPAALSPVKEPPPYTLYRRLGGPQSRSGRCGEEKIISCIYW